jgi:hypothetical protein
MGVLNRLRRAVSDRPSIAWIVILVLPLIVQACNSGGGKGY